jgi:hypothetical protein
MSWAGADPNLSIGYNDYVLLFNEPDRPDQANLTPETGVALYKALCLKYPQAKWVVGNVFYAVWLYTFKTLCLLDPSIPMPTTWGLHAYTSSADYVPRMLSYLEDAHVQLGGDFWITEFGSVVGDVFADNALVKFFESKPWIKRWAIFCNRAKGDEWWFPQAWHDFQLFDWTTGELTNVGKWYRDGLHQIFIPIVRKD